MERISRCERGSNVANNGVESNGSGLLFHPELYTNNPSSNLDETMVQDALREFEDLKEKNGLPFPDYGLDDYSKLRSTINYPPEGSISAPKGPGRIS